MVEWRNVAGAPRELCAQASVNTVLVVIIGSHVTDFLLASAKGVQTGHELENFKITHLGHVTSIAHSLDLGQMSCVVHEVEHKVVLQGNIKGLQLFGSTTAAGNGTVDLVGGVHELYVLGFDLVNNAFSVDARLVAFPVDGSVLALRPAVVKVENRLKLGVNVLGLSVSGRVTKAAEPVVGEFVGRGNTAS